MKKILKSVKIFDKTSPFHNKTKDILIENGIFTEISDQIQVENAEILAENCFISQGWADSSVSFGEPGFEDNETLENGLKVAEKSGFTQIMLNPQTSPITDIKQAVSFLKNHSTKQCEIFPIGALTSGSKGEYLAELYDMHLGGAVAFGDYKRSLSNANLMKIALQYTQNFGGILISFALDRNVAGKGVVNEHFTSTKLGLKGIPSLAEELIIARDLQLLEYTGGRLHIPTISSKKSVELIKQAKAKGLDVSCSVAIHHLHFNDEILEDFNTDYKVLPPLCNRENQEVLKQAILDGIIDMVTTDHCPINIEQKQLEFDYASYGTIGLETAFGILSQHFSVEKSVELLTNAKYRFDLPKNPIKEGEKVNLTIFTDEGSSIFTKEEILSSSKNSAFLGEKLKGKVLKTLVF